MRRPTLWPATLLCSSAAYGDSGKALRRPRSNGHHHYLRRGLAPASPTVSCPRIQNPSRTHWAPKSAADLAFLLHGFHYLKDDGVMAIILPHGVLFRGGAEAKIRRKLLDDGHIDTVIGLPANLFYSTGCTSVRIQVLQTFSISGRQSGCLEANVLPLQRLGECCSRKAPGSRTNVRRRRFCILQTALVFHLLETTVVQVTCCALHSCRRRASEDKQYTSQLSIASRAGSTLCLR